MANRTKQIYQLDVRAGIETRYGMDGPRIESRWGQDFLQASRPSLLYNGTESFPGVKRPERGVDHSLPSSAEVKEREELYMYSPPSWVFVACCRMNFTNWT